MPKQKKHNQSLLLKHKTKISLVTLFLVSIFLRSYNLSRALFFGPEQGIDFFRIKSIVVDHHPVLVGAKTDIAGVFHGPIYYYLGSLPFLISSGDPFFIAFFFILINCLTVFLIYCLGKELFNRRVGILSALFFTISFGAITYTHWLSSHPLVIPLTSLFLLSFVRFISGKSKYLFLVSISYALLGQAEFLNYLFFGVIIGSFIIIYFKVFKSKTIPFYLLNILVILIFGFFHYVIFDYKNGFIMSKSILSLFHGKGYYVSFITVLSQICFQFIEAFGKNVTPFLPTIIPFVIFLFALYLLFKSENKDAKKILLPTLFIPLLLLFLLRHAVLEQFFVYAIAPSFLLVGFLADYLMQKKNLIGVLLIVLITIISLRIWYLYVPENKYMFFASTQPELHLSDEKKVIDEIYKRQNGKNFSFQSYTIPYWTQDAWEYLFWQYGASKYGYPPVTKNGKTLYVIIQDDPSSERFQKDWLKYTVSKWGDEKGTFRTGIFTVKILDATWIK